MVDRKHIHDDGYNIGPGELHLSDRTIKFVTGRIFKNITQERDEQRLCITLFDVSNISEIRQMSQPFGEVHLDDPIKINHIRIDEFKVFLLSATISGEKVDLLISPKINKFEFLFD